MATHSSILPWRIPWTEEPGRLESMGLHREQLSMHACMHLGDQKTQSIKNERRLFLHREDQKA